MSSRILWSLVLVPVLLATSQSRPANACCPVSPFRVPVVNADQTVILLWDAATHTQHFIRKATFESNAEDFGFIVPSPTQPELEESGNEAFPFVQKLTEPEIRHQTHFFGCGATASSNLGLAASGSWSHASVQILEQKEVAGFNAVVLEAKSSEALVHWLREHGYTLSPAVQAWARPYVEKGWKFTALKIARDRNAKGKSVAAAALRISFKTDRPLFPYREPDPTAAAKSLGVKDRVLRIFFIAEARYRGELTRWQPWTGGVVWSDKLSAETKAKLLEHLQLPAGTGPATFWLTEFEDHWPYEAAPADVYFSRDSNQRVVHRDPIYVSTGWPKDGSVYAIAVALVLPPLMCRVRRNRG